MINQTLLRNFAIIAHVDHGKSTLSDRFLEITHTIEKDKLGEQFLDMNVISKKRGITIKLAPVRMKYHTEIPNSNFQTLNKSQLQNSNNQNGLEIRNSDLGFTDAEYVLNLIDTPGHVDFSYEVSRTLAACEGAVLLVDATQGIQAQTVAHFHEARKQNLVMIPVIIKSIYRMHRQQQLSKNLFQFSDLQKKKSFLFLPKLARMCLFCLRKLSLRFLVHEEIVRNHFVL